jgi:hypothetical protein
MMFWVDALLSLALPFLMMGVVTLVSRFLLLRTRVSEKAIARANEMRLSDLGRLEGHREAHPSHESALEAEVRRLRLRSRW